MVKLFNQLSLSDTFSGCKDTYQNEKLKFLEIRVNVEKNIQYFEEPMVCGNAKTRNNVTIKADYILYKNKPKGRYALSVCVMK